MPSPDRNGRRSLRVLECAFVHNLRLSVCSSVTKLWSYVNRTPYSENGYIANNSRTHRPSVSKFGMKVPHLRCDSHRPTSFKVKRSKFKVTRPTNADTHPAVYLSMRTYRVPLVGVSLFLGHFRINLHQTRTQYSNEGPQHCNWAEFSKFAF